MGVASVAFLFDTVSYIVCYLLLAVVAVQQGRSWRYCGLIRCFISVCSIFIEVDGRFWGYVPSALSSRKPARAIMSYLILMNRYILIFTDTTGDGQKGREAKGFGKEKE